MVKLRHEQPVPRCNKSTVLSFELEPHILTFNDTSVGALEGSRSNDFYLGL